jgi:cytochrome c oxidase cbb3-type subunit 3
MLRSDPERILSQPVLRRTALTLGEPVYQQHCASCHGATGKGDHSLGVPDLTASRHLYGEGRVAEIEDITRHGIRSTDKRGLSLASMPAYGTQHPYKSEPLPSLTPVQMEAVTQYLLAFRGQATDRTAAAEGGVLFRDYAGCYDCHGYNAQGDASIGAPSLVDGGPLYGAGSHDDIYRTLLVGRAGYSPAFGRLLNAAELRSVAVYVASLQIHPSQQADAR